MSITLELPTEIEEALTELAQADGQIPVNYATQILISHLAPVASLLQRQGRINRAVPTTMHFTRQEAVEAAQAEANEIIVYDADGVVIGSHNIIDVLQDMDERGLIKREEGTNDDAERVRLDAIDALLGLGVNSGFSTDDLHRQRQEENDREEAKYQHLFEGKQTA